TQRFRGHADQWRNIMGKDDDAVADQIRADQIDILIDPTLHMARNRLLVMARKPAPVQVNWLAYPATSGLKAMDWRVTSEHLDPAGWPENSFNTERLARLPDTYLVYGPLVATDEPPVNLLPASRNGYVTFGST